MIYSNQNNRGELLSNNNNNNNNNIDPNAFTLNKPKNGKNLKVVCHENKSIKYEDVIIKN